MADQTGDGIPDAHEMASVVSIAAGALLANLVSLVILVFESFYYRGRCLAGHSWSTPWPA